MKSGKLKKDDFALAGREDSCQYFHFLLIGKLEWVGGLRVTGKSLASGRNHRQIAFDKGHQKSVSQTFVHRFDHENH